MNDRRGDSRILKIRRGSLRLVCVSLLLASLTTAVASASGTWEDLEAAMRMRGLDPAQVEIPGRVTEEMKAWGLQQVDPNLSADRAMQRLLAALIDRKGFNLKYQPDYTGSAREVFETRKANCLAFTHLFVGLSRELGFPAFYVHWTRVGRFRREGDLVLVSGHVSAGFGSPNDWYVLEFGAVEGMNQREARHISDINAVARHYANRSAEEIQANRLQDAVHFAEWAVQLDPDLADGWVNLGVARRRSADLVGAEEAYRRATEVDPDNMAAYHNLMVLLGLRGRSDAARQVLALLDRRGNRNPFTYLELGDESTRLGDHREAGRFYKRASRLGPENAEVWAARGLWALAEEDLDAAARFLAKAQKLDASERRTMRLGQELSSAAERDR